MGRVRHRTVVLDAEPTILEASVVLDACVVLDGEVVVLDEVAAEPAAAASEEVLAELKGSITVRERLRALPWTGHHLCLCHDGGSSYRLCVQQLGHGSSASWPVSEGLRMHTEGLHSSSPSAKLEIPAGADAPMREHGRSASAPSPDVVLLAGSATSLHHFLAALRDVQKVLKRLNAPKRSGAAPHAPAPSPPLRHTRSHMRHAPRLLSVSPGECTTAHRRRHHCCDGSLRRPQGAARRHPTPCVPRDFTDHVTLLIM